MPIATKMPWQYWCYLSPRESLQEKVKKKKIQEEMFILKKISHNSPPNILGISAQLQSFVKCIIDPDDTW